MLTWFKLTAEEEEEEESFVGTSLIRARLILSSLSYRILICSFFEEYY
jgi:hypothetical protein